MSLEDMAEQALKDSEAKYRTLYNSMDAAVMLMAGARCVDCNPATARLFGLSDPSLVIGKTPLDFAPEYQPDGRRSADIVQENIVLALQNNGRAFEWHTARADGTPIVLEVLFTPFALGGGELFQCIARDISERKRAKLQLQESEARFRAIIERAAEGIIVAELATRRFRYANPEMCRMLGYSQEELCQLGLEHIHPLALVPGLIDHFDRRVHRGQAEVQTQCVRKDGSVFEVGLRAIPLELDGTPCLVGFFRDDSIARMLESERLRAQKLEALGILAGGIAHDFNNLLQGVFGFVSVAKQVMGDPAKSRAMLEQAEQALHMAVGLTSQLLTFSRGGHPVKQPMRVAPAIELAARLALSGSGSNYVRELPGDLWPVDADENQLAQVFQNIVLNADQAMPTGGTVAISARNVEEAEITLPAHATPGRFVAISVRDAGIGIRALDLPRVFDPYFTTKARGSGLGLATAYAIIKAHGGFIDVQSTLGEGSTFTVYLPATDLPLTSAAPSLCDETTRSARILVMDDEEMVRRVSVDLLRTLGHEADLSEHGARALELYRDARRAGRPYAAVILDLTVRGGMGGLETLSRLREEDAGVKAIVSSGYSDDAAVADFRAHGFSAVLRKPYTCEQLKQALRMVLQ